MAMRELSQLNRDSDGDEEVWVKHYSSNHQILLVGEGDFSFSHSLATLFGSASNICASSLDSYDVVVRKYKKARSNLKTLKRLGALLLHGVDATTLHFHPDLRYRRFDRVIFNFPHAGFHGRESDSSLIRFVLLAAECVDQLLQLRGICVKSLKHRELVFGFFNGASRLLRANGEVHVSHKNKAPFSEWNLEELASRCFLVLIQRVAFEKNNYPGYENKRGDGRRCDQPFLLGECSTFKFRFSRVAKELYAEKVRSREVKERESMYPEAILNKQPVSFDHRYRLQTEFEGVSQRPVLFDLSYRGDYNLRQVQDPLFHESSTRRTRVSPDIYDEIIQRMLTRTSFPHLYAGESPERHRLLCQDFPVQASQEPLSEYSNRWSGVSREIYNWEVTYLRKNFSGYGDGNKVSEAWSDSSISKNGVIYVIFCFLAWQLVNY
nr:F20N2.17 [Arabidopsis thaliana]